MPQLFGAKLRFLRHKHQFTQVALAERLALASHAHIANVEASHDVPSLDLVLRIARVFSVTTDYLLRDSIPVEAVATSAACDRPAEEVLAHLFGPKLRALRLRYHLTQVVLTHQLGLARQGYISNLEAGRKTPSLDLIAQIADHFAVTTDYLLRDTIAVGTTEEGSTHKTTGSAASDEQSP